MDITAGKTWPVQLVTFNPTTPDWNSFQPATSARGVSTQPTTSLGLSHLERQDGTAPVPACSIVAVIKAEVKSYLVKNSLFYIKFWGTLHYCGKPGHQFRARTWARAGTVEECCLLPCSLWLGLSQFYSIKHRLPRSGTTQSGLPTAINQVKTPPQT